MLLESSSERYGEVRNSLALHDFQKGFEKTEELIHYILKISEEYGVSFNKGHVFDPSNDSDDKTSFQGALNQLKTLDLKKLGGFWFGVDIPSGESILEMRFSFFII